MDLVFRTIWTYKLLKIQLLTTEQFVINWGFFFAYLHCVLFMILMMCKWLSQILHYLFTDARKWFLLGIFFGLQCSRNHIRHYCSLVRTVYVLTRTRSFFFYFINAFHYYFYYYFIFFICFIVVVFRSSLYIQSYRDNISDFCKEKETNFISPYPPPSTCTNHKKFNFVAPHIKPPPTSIYPHLFYLSYYDGGEISSWVMNVYDRKKYRIILFVLIILKKDFLNNCLDNNNKMFIFSSIKKFNLKVHFWGDAFQVIIWWFQIVWFILQTILGHLINS